MMQSLRCLILVALALATVPVTVPAQEQLGKVSFPTSCSPAVQADFERAVALLHSFWLDAGGKAFAAVAQADPTCAMAYWGTAVIKLGNPLGPPPTAEGARGRLGGHPARQDRESGHGARARLHRGARDLLP